MAAGIATALMPFVKPVASHLLDQGAKKFGLEGPRALLKALTGFNSRQAKRSRGRASAKTKRAGKSKRGGGKGAPRNSKPAEIIQDGGQVITTADAPVAFARSGITPFLKQLQSNKNGEIMHVVDLVGTLTSSASANTYAIGQFAYVSPVNSTLFPNMFSEFEGWAKYRPLFLRLHYSHFAPTSTQGAVGMHASSDCGEADPTSTGEAMARENAIQGSAYEDFALETDTAPWNDMKWFENSVSPALAADIQSIYCGRVGWSTDMNSLAAATAWGFCYVEAIFEFAERKKNNLIVGISGHQDLLAQCPPDRRVELCQYLAKKYETYLLNLPVRAKTARQTVEDLLGPTGVKPSPGVSYTDLSVRAVNGTPLLSQRR
nr:MAG: putative capsid protein [Permutotetraviridae sp.]